MYFWFPLLVYYRDNVLLFGCRPDTPSCDSFQLEESSAIRVPTAQFGWNGIATIIDLFWGNRPLFFGLTALYYRRSVWKATEHDVIQLDDLATMMKNGHTSPPPTNTTRSINRNLKGTSTTSSSASSITSNSASTMTPDHGLCFRLYLA